MTIHLHKEWVCGLCGKVYEHSPKRRKPKRCECEKKPRRAESEESR